MPFRWTINPYRGCTHACVYCFARPTHTYLDFDAGRDFEREIVVKVNTPERARAELSKPSWKHEHVALGTNTDPYQWVEKQYRLMPGVWEAMRDSGTPCSVLTKSPLLLRDIELFKQIPDFAANLSIPTLDEKAWRASEPHTPHPRKRIEAVAELNRAGIPRGVLIAPLMPGINDSPEQVERILELCAEAGAVERRRDLPAPARRGARGVHGLAALLPARPACRATRSSTRAAPTRRRRSASAARGWSAARARGHLPGPRAVTASAAEPAQPPEPAQTTLF